MDKFYNKTLYELETTINDLEIEADYSIQRIGSTIYHILECLSELKGNVQKRGGKDTLREILVKKMDEQDEKWLKKTPTSILV